MKDYYKLLDIPITATQQEIKSQYRLLLHAWHPDKFSTPEQKKQAEEKIKEFNEAYGVLGNPEKRKEYDRQNTVNPEEPFEKGSTTNKTSSYQGNMKNKSNQQSENKKPNKSDNLTGSKTSKRKSVNKKNNIQSPAKNIQYAAFAVIVFVALVFVFSFLSKLQNKETETTAGGGEVVASTSPACGIFDAIPAAEQYTEAPAQLIDEAKQYFATFKLAKGGEFVVELYPAKAPITVNSFAFLACKGYFNGVTFHRVLEGFMAQGGDPTGTGMGGPGYEFVNENSDLVFDKAGVLAMANAGPDTNGSQFFITFAPADFLNGGYTIFGQVVEGMDTVNAITRRDPDQNPSFAGDAIETVTITEK